MAAAEVPAKQPSPADQVFTWIVEGRSRKDIIESIETLFPEMKAQPLIVAAFKKIAESAKNATPDILRGWAVEATRTVYSRALESGDFATALRAIKQLASLPE